MPIVVIGLSHHSSPVAVREQFAFEETRIPMAIQSLREQGIADEAVILSTCNRVEIYAATSLDPAAACAELKGFLTGSKGCGDLPVQDLYALNEPHSVAHLFRVACGLDSMVLGETEILGQLKKAYELALRHGHTGKWLNKTFQRAFNVAKHIRTETSIQRGSISVASVAVELAEKIFDSLKDRRVMVIGAGETGEKAARALASRGAGSLVVANRSHDRAVALAGELGGRAAPFENWLKELEQVDIAITSTSASQPILNRANLEPLMKLRKNRSLLLIDIAVPRNIDPEVNLLASVYLFNLDDLQAVANDYLQQRKEEVARCEAIIQEKVRGMLVAASGRDSGAGVRPAFGA